MKSKETKIVDDNPASPEQMARFEEWLKEPYKEHESETRRSIEIHAGFYEKLATLSAGSIAVAASIVLTIALKPEAHSAPLRTVLHDLLEITGLLWLSLVFAITHNFLAAHVAKMEAEYSEIDFIRKLMRQTLALAREVEPKIDDSTAEQAERLIHEEPAKKQSKIVKRKQILNTIGNVIGYISMLTFLTAYTLVVVYLRRLW